MCSATASYATCTALYPSASAVLTYFLIVISLMRDDLMIISLLLLLLLTLFPFFGKGKKRRKREKKERKKEGLRHEGERRSKNRPPFRSKPAAGNHHANARARKRVDIREKKYSLRTNRFFFGWVSILLVPNEREECARVKCTPPPFCLVKVPLFAAEKIKFYRNERRTALT